MSDFAETRTDLTGVGLTLARATSTKSGSTCTAYINGTTVTVEVARDLTVAVGDILLVGKVGAQWFAISRQYTAAPAEGGNDASPVPNPVTVSGTLVVAPVETRSYRNGAWRTDNANVYQGQWGGNGNHTGCAFYGSAPRSLAGATVSSATIQVRRTSGGWNAAQPTTMRLVTESTRPGGAPTLGSSTSGPSLAIGATSNAFTIPTSWAQAMVDGTSGGLGFFVSSADPYVIFAGNGEWSPAFSMTINWTR